MTREEAIKVLEMFLYKQCDLERTKFAYDDITVWDAVKMASEALKREPKIEWIPIKTRPLTEEEHQYFDGYSDIAYNCPLPDDGQEVLITSRYGDVLTDTFCRDYGGCYFETYCDDGDVLAWMPLPESYKAESEKKE